MSSCRNVALDHINFSLLCCTEWSQNPVPVTRRRSKKPLDLTCWEEWYSMHQQVLVLGRFDMYLESPSSNFHLNRCKVSQENNPNRLNSLPFLFFSHRKIMFQKLFNNPRSLAAPGAGGGGEVDRDIIRLQSDKASLGGCFVESFLKVELLGANSEGFLWTS